MRRARTDGRKNGAYSVYNGHVAFVPCFLVLYSFFFPVLLTSRELASFSLRVVNCGSVVSPLGRRGDLIRVSKPLDYTRRVLYFSTVLALSASRRSGFHFRRPERNKGKPLTDSYRVIRDRNSSRLYTRAFRARKATVIVRRYYCRDLGEPPLRNNDNPCRNRLTVHGDSIS